MCFQRGQATDAEWKKFKQESAAAYEKIKRKPRVKRHFEARYGMSLDEIFKDGSGPVVDIKPVANAEGEHKNGRITIDPANHDWQLTILHEVEHYAADEAARNGIDRAPNPIHWDAHILSQLSKLGNRLNPHAGRDNFYEHGTEGFTFTWLVFGRVY